MVEQLTASFLKLAISLPTILGRSHDSAHPENVSAVGTLTFALAIIGQAGRLSPLRDWRHRWVTTGERGIH